MSSAVRCLVLAASALVASGCADLAKIGALCPVGCAPQGSDRVCDCGQARAGRSGGVADAAVGGSVDTAAPSGGGGAPNLADAATVCMPSSAQAYGNLIVALDGSASLVPWWPALSDGFRRFIQDDGSRGLGVGLLTFDDVCETEPYVSALVPIAPLPDNLRALQEKVPSGTAATTSTTPVLRAAFEYAKEWLAAHPNERVSVLLVTDASPGICDGLMSGMDMVDAELARMASEALSGDPSIKTYAIGGDGLPNIGPLAQAGGTQAFVIQPLSTSDDVVDALRDIRSAVSADACAER